MGADNDTVLVVEDPAQVLGQDLVAQATTRAGVHAVGEKLEDVLGAADAPQRELVAGFGRPRGKFTIPAR